MTSSRTLADALARLDDDVKEAEARAAGLRRQRDAVAAFLAAYLDGNVVSKRPVEQIDVIVSGTGQSAIVEKIISGHNLVDFSIDDVDTLAREEGQSLTREQINNAVTYLRRRGVVEKRPGRGNWRRRGVVAGTPNEDGPAEAGPSVELPSPVASEVEAG